MTNVRRTDFWLVLSNTRYVLINRLAMPVASFLLLIAIGKKSGVLLGEYALVTTFYYIMQTLPLLGLAPFIAREVSRNPRLAGNYFSTIGSLSLFICLGIKLLADSVLRSSVYPDAVTQAVRVVGIAIIPGILAFLAEIILVSMYKSRPVAYIAVAENVLRLCGSLVALHLGFGIVTLMWILLGTRFLSLAAYTCFLRRYAEDSIFKIPDTALMKDVRRVLPAFLMNSILLLVVSRFDYIVLSLNVTLEEVGYYAVAYRLFEIGLLLVSAVMTAIFPWASRKYFESARQFSFAMKHFSRAFMVSVFPLAFIAYLFADDYVRLLFRHQYPYPVALTKIFMIVFAIAAIDQLLSMTLNATERQSADLKSLSVGSGIYALTLIGLVPSLGIYGAAVALILAVTAQLCLRLRYCGGYLAPMIGCRDFAVTLASAALLFAPATLLPPQNVILRLFMAVTGLFAYPLLLMRCNVLQPLRFFGCTWRDRARDLSTPSGVLDAVATDLRRHRRKTSGLSNVGRGHTSISLGLLAVLLYRLGRFFYLNDRLLLARLFWQVNILLTKADIPLQSDIGSGLVLTNPAGVVIAGKVGRNVSFGAWSGIGSMGKLDAGAGPGIPVIGQGVTFGPRSVVLGGLRVPDGLSLPPHARIFNVQRLSAIRERYAG